MACDFIAFRLCMYFYTDVISIILITYTFRCKVTSHELNCLLCKFTFANKVFIIQTFRYHDSLCTLLEVISPGYKVRFTEKLAQRLRLLEVSYSCYLLN
jgi:hypothetical protein